MRKGIVGLLAIVLCVVLAGCNTVKLPPNILQTTDDTINSQHAPTEDLPPKTPEYLLCGIWTLEAMVKDGERYEEDEDGERWEFSSDGYCYLYDGKWDPCGPWMLQQEYLTVYFGRDGSTRFHILTLTEDTLILDDLSEGDVQYELSLQERERVQSEPIVVTAEQLVGRWIDPEMPDSQLVFHEDGSGESLSGDGDASFTWYLTNGNRLVVYTGDEMIWLIDECNSDILSIRGLAELIRAGV